jgi:hypothetical protein
MADRDDGVRRELGISRRELIRRGAIVGGTLLWATPVIQSLSPPAFAAPPGGTPAACSCCCCVKPIPVPGGTIHCTTDSFDRTFCEAFCAGAGGPRPGTQGFCTGADCDDINNRCVCN